MAPTLIMSTNDMRESLTTIGRLLVFFFSENFVEAMNATIVSAAEFQGDNFGDPSSTFF